MLPVGHAAAAYLLYTFSARSRETAPPSHWAVLIVGVASQLPDLIDKPLAWYAGVLPGGRTLGHSLFVLVALSAVVYLVARRRGVGEYGIAFAVGVVSHTLLDSLPALWDSSAQWEGILWPVLSPGGVSGEGAPSVIGLLAESATEPYFLVEVVLLVAALYVWRADGYPGLGLVLRTDPA